MLQFVYSSIQTEKHKCYYGHMKNINFKNTLEIIVFGGGCFWCLEPIFSQIKGVHETAVGYAGGQIANPTYEEVYDGKTGHAEVVCVVFNPKEVSFKAWLEVFFTFHDPTTVNRQGNDIGEQYRSIIFITKVYQAKIITDYITEIQPKFKNPIVTEIKALEQFYPAEDYHQNYFLSNKNAPYCQIAITPKITKFRQIFKKIAK